jgi:uncharacterized membrane-anchored protein YitT (DUF2179 family)
MMTGALGGALTGGILAFAAALLWNSSANEWARDTTSFPMLATTYVLWGALLGCGLGAVFPWARTTAGSAICGAVIMASGYIAVGMLLDVSSMLLAVISAGGAVAGAVAGRKVLGPGSPYLSD